MKKLQAQEGWPDAWKLSYIYYLEEIYGAKRNFGYCYAYFNRQKHTLTTIRRFVPLGSRILDVAAAQGNFSLRLAEAGYRVTWNDLRSELADYVELKRETGSIDYAP